MKLFNFTQSFLLMGLGFASVAAIAVTPQLPDNLTIKDVDMYLSDNGPEDDSIFTARGQYLPYAGKDTYTYVRCHYSLADNILANTKPNTDYVWARNPNGSYYKLAGYWYSDELFQWKNMFYTATDYSTIKDLCDQTVTKAVGYPKQAFDYHAANNSFSFNHTLWYNQLPENSKFDRVVSFGDSLSDTGNIYNASQMLFPNQQSWFNGRFSNGLVWVDYLSADLKIPLANWAVGGAGGDTQKLVLPGLRQQVTSWAEYMSAAKNYDPSRSLFTILIGGNDFINYGRNVDEVIADVRASLNTLLTNSANNLLILNLPDLSVAPALEMGSSKPSNLKPTVVNYNNQIKKLVIEFQGRYPQAKIHLFDTYTLLNQVLNDPASYGITDTKQPCLNITQDSVFNYLNTQLPSPMCSDASRSIFWDSLHITSKIHRILADQLLVNLNKNPTIQDESSIAKF